jgi:DNA-binding NarL/FixJ family response regulator
MKLLLVDDHPVVREGLTALIRQMIPDSKILSASSAIGALEIVAAEHDIDAVLLDLAMPGMDGFAALAAFAKMRPELPIIVLSASEDPADVRRAISGGAQGYILKSTEPRAMMAAVQFVLDSGVYVPPSVFFGEVVETEASPAPEAGPLTQRQLEVLQLICRGLPNKEIANALDLSEKTVKAHVTTIFRALGVVNRTQAANAARRLGLIDGEAGVQAHDGLSQPTATRKPSGLP